MRFSRVILFPILAAFCMLCSLNAFAAQRQCVIVEDFTNDGCGPCASYNPGIRATLDAMTRDTVVKIAYHVYWPDANDLFYLWNTGESNQRTTYYGVGAVPDLFVDYLLQPDPASTTTLRNNIRTRYAVSSPCTIALSANAASTTSVHFSGTVTAEQNMTGSNYRLYVMLISDLITFGSPPGPNGETIFPDVFRDASPNANSGQSFSIGAGQVYNFDGTLNKDASWDGSNLTVIAFVQNTTNKEILQAKWAELVPPSIALVSPNGGETWYSGESHDVTWTSLNLFDNVKIEVNRNYPGSSWETVAAGVPNTGTYNWIVNGPGSVAARVRVSPASQPSVADSSNANLTIPGLNITSPNGGETWYVGASNIIAWNTAGLSEAVRIELNRNYPSGTWDMVTPSTPNSGTYAWTPTGSTTSTARFRVVGTVHTMSGDSSNANLMIAARSITLTSPNGGELWSSGETHNITWTSQFITGYVAVEINRNYPSGSWEVITASASDIGLFSWTVSGPATYAARIRLSSVSYPSVTDESNANFVVNVPPMLRHDALHDITTGSGTVTALAWDPTSLNSVISVKMFYRPVGNSTFDSLALNLTGGLNEYAASLSFLPTGSYEYFVRVADDGGQSRSVPASGLYAFRADPDCGSVLSYDDGSAEFYNYTEDGANVEFRWAVKFTAAQPAFLLCGARFAASRSVPDSIHTPVHVYVYAADGPSGMPGTLIAESITGSVGNVIGGLPSGTNWAQANLRDALGLPLVINSADFYIAVGNIEAAKYEAFGRDTNGPNAHRSYVYDACLGQWFNQDDTGSSTNAFPGNMLIQAVGYGLLPPSAVTIAKSGNDMVLQWNDFGAPLYKVYCSTAMTGASWDYVGSTTSTSFTHVNALAGGAVRFYYVTSAIE